MIDVQNMIVEALVGRKLTSPSLGRQTYVKVSRCTFSARTGDDRQSPSLTIQQSGAPGGAWSSIGNALIHEDRVVLKLKTIHGIFYSKNEIEEFVFQFYNPGFPDNVSAFLQRAAINAEKTWSLLSRQTWGRHARTGSRRKYRTRKEQEDNAKNT
jgi:hypothetical protein